MAAGIDVKMMRSHPGDFVHAEGIKVFGPVTLRLTHLSVGHSPADGELWQLVTDSTPLGTTARGHCFVLVLGL